MMREIFQSESSVVVAMTVGWVLGMTVRLRFWPLAAIASFLGAMAALVWVGDWAGFLQGGPTVVHLLELMGGVVLFTVALGPISFVSCVLGYGMRLGVRRVLKSVIKP